MTWEILFRDNIEIWKAEGPTQQRKMAEIGAGCERLCNCHYSYQHNCLTIAGIEFRWDNRRWIITDRATGIFVGEFVRNTKHDIELDDNTRIVLYENDIYIELKEA